jgi:triacylglycerol lipase
MKKPFKNLPILFVHGIYDTGRAFRAMARVMQDHGWQTHAINLEPNDGRVPLEQLAEQVAAFDKERLPQAHPFILIGFSMGGIVSRYYVQRLGGMERVSRLITIASPHHGTLLAGLNKTPGGKQLRPGSAFLAGLNRDSRQLQQVNHISIWTPFDLVVVPAASSILPGSQSKRIASVCHPCLLRDYRCLHEVRRLCEETEQRVAISR